MIKKVFICAGVGALVYIGELKKPLYVDFGLFFKAEE